MLTRPLLFRLKNGSFTRGDLLPATVKGHEEGGANKKNGNNRGSGLRLMIDLLGRRANGQ